MFAYCNNHPINYKDMTGDFPWTILALVVVGAYVLTNFTASDKIEPTEEQIHKIGYYIPISAVQNRCEVIHFNKEENLWTLVERTWEAIFG